MFNYYQHMFLFIKSNISNFKDIAVDRLHFLSPENEDHDFIGKRSELPMLVHDSVFVTSTLYNHGMMNINLILVDNGILLEYQPEVKGIDNWYVWIKKIVIDCEPTLAAILD